MGLDHDSSNLRPTSRIQWNQLTHLYLGKQVSYAKALMVLKTATALEQGCFDLENSRLLEYMPTNTTLLRESDGFLPNLKDLTFLRNSPFGNPFSDYGQFSWPSLIALRLCIRDRLSWNSSTPLLFGSLTNLHLRTSNVTEFGTGVAPILNACPLLASLTLDLKLEEYRPFFEFLTLDPARPHLVHLASLKIFWEEGLGDSDAAFHAPVYEMLASRTDICAKSEEGSDSEHSSPATAVVPDNFSLKTFTLYLGGQPAADEVAKIGRNFAGLERFMEISVFGRKRWKPMKIWEEIPLDHWDDGVGPMLDSEDGLILESEDDFWYDYESDY
ncbi:hypothetical protein EST38_g9420 [Candolleomyces aberdarensis]|uniref:F-box protein n=1 Tax=Candolleomyces aberdarensis TaxID=2316362 RepID=A0A4Q2DAS5_9AGAR|nr:hypothetical protein EST38_g9420 [Candolleomyces aberdarensis]